MMKYLLLAVIVVGLGCDAPQPRKPREVAPQKVNKIGEEIEWPNENETQRVVINGWHIDRNDFPNEATNIVPVGEGWFEFDYKGNRYLLRNHGRKTMQFELRDRVQTKIDPDNISDDWDNPGIRRDNARAVVVNTSDAHGLCYKVKYADGNTGWFDPHELVLVEKNNTEQRIADFFNDPNAFE
ncbi:unnamed protein product [Symbiodinium microadriaticum]|nr:unnamed protein product [Symbiodinium microadriaticum]